MSKISRVEVKGSTAENGADEFRSRWETGLLVVQKHKLPPVDAICVARTSCHFAWIAVFDASLQSAGAMEKVWLSEVRVNYLCSHVNMFCELFTGISYAQTERLSLYETTPTNYAMAPT